jgi:hypothetical protein
MTETPVLGLPLRPSPEEQTYPTLTTAQVARVASYGRVRPVAEGEILIEAGSQLAPFFVFFRDESAGHVRRRRRSLRQR